MEPMIVGGIIFVLAVFVIELVIYAVKNARSPDRTRIRKRLRKFMFIEEGLGGS